MRNFLSIIRILIARVNKIIRIMKLKKRLMNTKRINLPNLLLQRPAIGTQKRYSTMQKSQQQKFYVSFFSKVQNGLNMLEKPYRPKKSQNNKKRSDQNRFILSKRLQKLSKHRNFASPPRNSRIQIQQCQKLQDKPNRSKILQKIQRKLYQSIPAISGNALGQQAQKIQQQFTKQQNSIIVKVHFPTQEQQQYFSLPSKNYEQKKQKSNILGLPGLKIEQKNKLIIKSIMGDGNYDQWQQMNAKFHKTLLKQQTLYKTKKIKIQPKNQWR